MNRKQQMLKIAPVEGWLEGITPDGRLLVSWGDPKAPPIAAKIATNEPSCVLREAAEARAAVHLQFYEGDPERPVIMGLIRERLEAEDELSLQCGESAIHLRRDGRVTIRGCDIEALSTGPIKIKGGSVRIN
jgi:hypothetical protein